MTGKTAHKPQAKIIVAAHKPYPMPCDPLYLPLFVGAEGRTDAEGKPLDIGFQKDNTGDNISSLNPGFCELTGLYWAWKNLDADYIGLAHYRRHFASLTSPSATTEGVLTEAELLPLLSGYDVFVPKKRRYVIETLYSHYAHTHYAGHLDRARALIISQCPEYLPDFDAVMKARGGYMFNMMIMRRDLLDRYARFLFPILFALMEELKEDEETGALSSYQGRLYGRVSELLFNVFLRGEVRCGRIRRERIRELPLVSLEKTNWVKKGSAFLMARFFNKRYEGSF